MPAYGGRLFDPDRFPFLEGRKQKTRWQESEATPLPVNNRTVLHLLEALQLLQIKVPGGGPAEARRLSFRALDIEQIGHVYEGLLDHTAKRAAEPFLGLAGSKGKEPEIAFSELEKQRDKGSEALLAFLKEATGRTPKSLEKGLSAELDAQATARFRTACQTEDLWKRVEPFAGLVRSDTFGYPVVIPTGSVFVTEGTDRRSSGTHYTPRSLTEPIVQYTLEPLVYVGPAEGKPKSEWKLKSAADLLDLKICDMACGSGAFLVQAARYMSVRLMEAWEVAKKAHPETPGITPEGKPSTGEPNESLIPTDPAEQKTYAMRIVAQRCLYGVDINPLATEMAKLSLWLLTLAKDKPFEFLDHAIRCGDSLVGLHDINQLRHFNLKPDSDDAVLFGGPFEEAVEQAIELRLKLEDMPSNTVEDVEAQEKLLKEADDNIARLRCAADLLVAAEFWGENAKDKQEKVRHAAVVAGHYVEKGPTEEFEEKAQKERRGQKMFHWPLEFPEVIVKRGGFDVFIGNPPFLWGMRISTYFGEAYLAHLQFKAGRSVGTADLCAHFFLRANEMVRRSGVFGLLATDTISTGDTREVSLDQLAEQGSPVFRCIPKFPWPGNASVQVAVVHTCRGEWSGDCFINDVAVNAISPQLSSGEVYTPHKLVANFSKAFIGHYPMGKGFVVTHEEADALRTKRASNSSVLFPYLTGEDVNTSPDQRASRWAINFDRRTENEAARFVESFELIKKLVKPERDKAKRKANRERWWQYAETRPGLCAALEDADVVFVQPFVSKYINPVVVDKNQVFASPMVVIANDGRSLFPILQSSLHDVFVRAIASNLGGTLRYAPTDCFETFPFPVSNSESVRKAPL